MFSHPHLLGVVGRILKKATQDHLTDLDPVLGTSRGLCSTDPLFTSGDLGLFSWNPRPNCFR